MLQVLEREVVEVEEMEEGMVEVTRRTKRGSKRE